MTEKANVRVQMNKDIIQEDEKIFKANNFTNQEVIELLFKQVLKSPSLPFPLNSTERDNKSNSD